MSPWAGARAQSLGGSENLLDFTVGRTQYTIGHGLPPLGRRRRRGQPRRLLEQRPQGLAVRGGRPLEAEEPHPRGLLPRSRRGPGERDRAPGSGGRTTSSRSASKSTLGLTYLKFHADRAVKPNRDGLNVFNARAFVSPFRALPDLSFELEYAHEENGDLLSSDAVTAQVGYEMSELAWTPKLSYRYAYFEGDDPATPTREGFDSLLPGFSDWGTWWQGEIAGEYFVSNSNLISHQVRLHLARAKRSEPASSSTSSSPTRPVPSAPR